MYNQKIIQMKSKNMKNILLNVKILIVLFIISIEPSISFAQYDLGQRLDSLQMQRIKKPTATGNVIDWNTLNLMGIDAFSPQNVSTIPGILSVDNNYKLGPSDRLGIYLLGQTHREYDILINPEGKAYIPSVEVFDFNGLSLSTAKEKIRVAFNKYFSEKKIEVMLTQPKQVMVSVVGEIKSPGRYSLNGLQTTFDAIYQAGGPKEKGSIRNIQVIHTDTQLVKIDLYNLLIHGIGKGGPNLLPGDIIKIAPLTSSVSIAGEITRPGRYELSSEYAESLGDLFNLASGPTPLAYLKRVEISRRQTDGTRNIRYVDARDSVNISNNFLLDGDRIRIYPITEQIHQPTVEIFGEVRRPGIYDLDKHLTLKDLILKAGGVTRSAYLLEAELNRISPKQPVERIKFSIGEILKGQSHEQNIELSEFDRVLIRRIPEWLVGPSVEVKGEVMFPGKYTITKDSTKLSHILQLSGGFTKDAFLKEAKLIRPSTRISHDLEYERLKNMRREEMSGLEYEYLVMKQNQNVGQVVVNFSKLWTEKNQNQDVILENGDIIQVPKIPQVVQVTGRVAKPGGILYKPGENINYYLKKAGGTTWDARPSHTKVIKSTGEILDDEDVKQLVAGDIIWIPRKPDRDFWRIFRDTIMVLGQVATIYLVVQNASK